MPNTNTKDAQERVNELYAVCQELSKSVLLINERLDKLESDKTAFMNRTSVQYAHLCDLEEKAIIRVSQLMDQDSALRQEIGTLSTLYRQHDSRAEKYIIGMSAQVKRFTTIFFIGTGGIIIIQTLHIVMALAGGG